MNRKIISVFLVLILCFSLAVSVSAEPKKINFVVDELGYLADEEITALNEYAASFYEMCGVGIFFVYTMEEYLEDYDIKSLTGDLEDYFVMIENEESWTTFKNGLGTDIDVDTEDGLREVYDAAETYVGGVEDFLYEVALCFPQIEAVPEVDSIKVEEELVLDEADLLDDSEEAALEQKLSDISSTYEAQIVVSTIESMDDADIDVFLEYAYDSMGLGYGENHDGVFLLVCMNPREYRILSNGFAGVAIDTDTIDSIGEEIVSDLSDGYYADAFDEFADQCAYYLDGYINGFPFNFGKTIVISLIIGLVAGLIVALVLKGQLKTVHKQNLANVYVKPDSMQVTARNDYFLRRDVTRTRKESKSDSSSSSGSSRSTGGGSF